MASHLHCNTNMSTFSALHLLRSYNHLLQPAASDLSHHYHQLLMAPRLPSYTGHGGAPGGGVGHFPHLGNSAYMSSHGLLTNYPSYPALLPLGTADKIVNPSVRGERECGSVNGSSMTSKRPRGEKKPIPDDLKDERYFERRKRNNRAAKKSRDARKIREDQIAIHASMLERENAIMRAQILSLRDEVSSLRHLLLKKTDKEVGLHGHHDPLIGAKT